VTQKLSGMTAVVTGGGGGIGREVALALVAEGARIVINDIGKDSQGKSLADKVVEEIKKERGTAVANYDNVATMEGGRNLIKTTTDEFGSVDILVNCAGFCKGGNAADTTEKDWDDVIAVNLKGTFSCVQAATKEMMKQKNGRIINFSSQASFTFNWEGFGSIPYAAAKAGVVGLTAFLSAELKQYGITVNGIFPGAITKGFPEKRPKFGGGEVAGPEYVPPIILYLATPEAKNITGQFFYACDGDIMILSRPMQLDGPNKFIRKEGKWTVDELCQVIPSLLGPGM
jgi:NAD(P)-dependent dehydrogenase (short-subunit alcohol dehydrogenase family)